MKVEDFSLFHLDDHYNELHVKHLRPSNLFGGGVDFGLSPVCSKNYEPKLEMDHSPFDDVISRF